MVISDINVMEKTDNNFEINEKIDMFEKTITEKINMFEKTQ